LKRTWCIGVINAVFIALMERILWLYSLAYDARYPVVCFDERPCFLIGEVVAALPMQSGQVAKEHYSYEKNGSCSLLAAIEPLTGKRLGQVYEQRTKKEYTLFMKALADHYPQAVKIRLLQDNLNTHSAASLYETFEPEEARLPVGLARPNVVQQGELLHGPPQAVLMCQFHPGSYRCLFCPF